MPPCGKGVKAMKNNNIALLSSEEPSNKETLPEIKVSSFKKKLTGTVNFFRQYINEIFFSLVFAYWLIFIFLMLSLYMKWLILTAYSSLGVLILISRLLTPQILWLTSHNFLLPAVDAQLLLGQDFSKPTKSWHSSRLT